MADYSREDWIGSIKIHLTEFDIQESGPDNYGLWRITITSKANRHYSDYGEDINKEVAKEEAIKRLAGVLYQVYKTPETL